MNGSDSPAPVTADPWWRHGNGRWVVGDGGRQHEIEPSAARGRGGLRPDTTIDGARINGLTYRATSQRGFAHQQDGRVRQDAYLVRPTPDRRWLIGCVADGVSEGNLSHEAADAACRESTLVLSQGLKDLAVDSDVDAWCAVVDDWPRVMASLPWQEAADQASARIAEIAREAVATSIRRDQDPDAAAAFDNRPWSDGDARRVMSATAVLFVVSTVPVDGGGCPAAVAVVAGDSVAFLLDRGAWTALTPTKDYDAEIATVAVQSLPRSVRVEPAALYLRPGQALVVMTDGLGDPLGTGAGEVGDFLAAHWSAPPDALAFAYQVGFYRRSFTDDRTAVVVWPSGS